MILRITLLGFLFTMALGQAEGQDLAGKKNTVVQFDFTMYESVLSKLDPYEPSTVREKENYREAKQYIEKKLVDNMSELTEKYLANHFSASLQPIQTLEDYKVVYNSKGYLNTMIVKSVIKKVNKKGYESDFFLACSVTLESTTDMLGKAKLTKQFKPQITFNISIFDDQGTKLQKFQGKLKAENPIKAKSFPSLKFDKMEIEYMDLLLEMLQPDLEAALEKALSQIS